MGAKILSRNEIIDRVKTGHIKLSYYFLSSGNPVAGNYEAQYDRSKADDDQCTAWKYFISCLEEDCLRLCVGPYALIEHRTLFRRLLDKIPLFSVRREFCNRNNQDIFDLRRSGSVYLFSNENILIGTNENITLGAGIGGSLYATVRNTDVGLPHISTTIDPGWSGRLQIGLVNATRTMKKLNLMEPICKVRFHEHETPCSPNSVTQKPHGLSWSEIENDVSKDFFPRRKETATRLQLEDFNWAQIFKLGTNAIAIVGGVLWAGNWLYDKSNSLSDHISEIDKKIVILSDRLSIEKIEHNLGELKKEVSGLDLSKTVHNNLFHKAIKATASINKQTFPITFDREYVDKPRVLIKFDDDNIQRIAKYETRFESQLRNDTTYYNSAIISIWFENSRQSVGHTIDFHVFIVD